PGRKFAQVNVNPSISISITPARLVVGAGPNQTLTLPSSATLSGTVTDPCLPTCTINTNWSMSSGPGAVIFGNAAALNTTAGFSSSGTYVLQLMASDGTLSSTASVTITVNAFASTGATYNAASCNRSDVNAVINGPTHVAVDGDVIQIPSGSC